MNNRYFPMFIPSAGKTALVAGGGKIASRRVESLLQFDFTIVVVSPTVNQQLKQLAEAGRVQWIRDTYHSSYLADADLATACTDDRAVNRQIGADARGRNIPVSVCDCKEECTFYFPAVAASDEVTCGIVGTGRDHRITKRAAAAIRELITRKAY
ncbi:bifunctional precorrin-2 dehydrogenase/sirohydrochlorin ferrochelatase [Ihubacter sp. mB4P-1]|uniref:precorrin-2 dehydrogenase/sirohydrochlorin ferrochelatase family protein n=1 Tax=Ihubacter sp. mB4P-1 TaxID=3242370 RepID=UPI0013798644